MTSQGLPAAPADTCSPRPRPHRSAPRRSAWTCMAARRRIGQRGARRRHTGPRHRDPRRPRPASGAPRDLLPDPRRSRSCTRAAGQHCSQVRFICRCLR